MSEESKKILVVGGGVSGVSAAVEAAEVGHEVILVERAPYLGGRVAALYQYFPKMCPPTCGLDIHSKRLQNNPRIEILTMAEVASVSGEPGNYNVKIKVSPRYVTGKAPVSQAQLDAVTTEVPCDFDVGMSSKKALSLPFDMAFPYMHALDKDALTNEELEALAKAEPKAAIDLEMKEEEIEVNVGAIVMATGWKSFDAKNMEELGFGKHANVVNNLQMERLCAINGPTGGKIQRPSDNAEPKTVAFVQCVGSRDENHLPYCSGVCCMGSLKQARYIREKLPEAEITIFYIDIRTIGRLEKFYYDLLGDEKIKFVKGKVPKITEGENKQPILHVEEMMAGKKLEAAFDLVILAAGVVPNAADEKLPGAAFKYDENGFVVDDYQAGLIGAGCSKRPLDVSRSVKDATAAALKAIQAVRR